jgi:transcriptional regulator with XRE-family HTH domain
MSEDRGTPELRHALAAKLRELRLERGITQERLAFLAKLHPTYISMLENGRKSPTVDALERIAQALDVRVSTIFAGAERSCGRSSPDE